MDLYNRIDELCKGKGLSIYKVCKIANISFSVIYDLKSGKKVDLNRKTAEKLATALGITVDELYGKEKTPDTNVSEVDLRIANVFKVLTDEQKELFLNLAEQLIQQ